jgi:hypothetical protein
MLAISYQGRIPKSLAVACTPSHAPIPEQVQAQGCPVEQLDVSIASTGQPSFGSGCKPDSCSSGGFRIPVSLVWPLLMTRCHRQAEAVPRAAVVMVVMIVAVAVAAAMDASTPSAPWRSAA